MKQYLGKKETPRAMDTNTLSAPTLNTQADLLEHHDSEVMESSCTSDEGCEDPNVESHKKQSTKDKMKLNSLMNRIDEDLDPNNIVQRLVFKPTSLLYGLWNLLYLIFSICLALFYPFWTAFGFPKF